MEKKKWFYVDIDTDCHVRIAVEAVDEDDAIDIAEHAVDTGRIDPTDTAEYPYGSSSDSIRVGDPEPNGPPKGMHRIRSIFKKG